MYFIGAKCLSGAAGARAALGATLARAGGSLGATLARAGGSLGASLARAGAGGATEFTAPVGGVFLHLLGIDEFTASATRAGARAALGATLALTRAGGSLGATLARAGAALGATLAGGGAGGARATELTAPEGSVLLHLLCWNEGGVRYPEEVMRYVCEKRGIQERSRKNEKYACAAG